MTIIKHRCLTASLSLALAFSFLGMGAGCAEETEGRQHPGLELIPINDADHAVLDTFENIRATTEANGVLSLEWDGVADPNVAVVEIWRPSMTKWASLAGGEWNPSLDSWGDRVATIPAGPAQWLDPAALVLDDNRYIIRTIDFAGEVVDGYVVEARPAHVFRAANWSDLDTDGVGTHDIDGEYVNVRGDGLDTVLFTVNRGEMGTISYEADSANGHDYLEVYFKSGVHAGKRGWVAKDYLRWSTLEVCNGDAVIRDGDNLEQTLGSVASGTVVYVISGQVRNTGQHRYFKVNAGGTQGWVATSKLCTKGTDAANGGGGASEPGNSGGSGYDAGLANALADAAYAGAVGYSMGRCYEYVWYALKSATGMTEARANQLGIPATSAYQFGDWADANPSALYSDFGLEKISSTAADAPVGSVIVWEPGQCGFSSAHGHIEIVASPGYACSDFCGYMYDDCGNPRVYMPVK